MDSLGVFLYAHLHVQIQVFWNVKEHIFVKFNNFVLGVVASKAWHDLHALQILSYLESCLYSITFFHSGASVKCVPLGTFK